MPPDVVVARHDPCPWLPAGGVAEVVLSAASRPPRPTSVVRLLATSGDAILVVPRPDGRGPDLPTAVVGPDEQAEAVLHALTASVLTGGGAPVLLGFVRNTVPGDVTDYPWPAPVAHFAVWSCEVGREELRLGEWLAGPDALARLADRHWWPLVARLPR